MTVRRLTVRDWHVVDGAMDNTAAVENVGGDADAAALARGVRDVGWRASREHPLARTGRLGWPPDDAELVIDLDPSVWAFVRDELRRWNEVSAELSTSERLDESQRAVQAESLRHRVAVLGQLRAD